MIAPYNGFLVRNTTPFLSVLVLCGTPVWCQEKKKITRDSLSTRRCNT